MKLRLKLPDGSVKETDADPTQVQTLLDQNLTTGEERGKQAQLEAHATALGLEPKDVTGENLQKLAKEAGDGRQYREDLLGNLHTLSLAVNGSDEKGRAAAARARKAFSTLDVTDIRDEVERLTALRDASLPGGRLSRDQDEPETQPKKASPDIDSV